MALDSLGAKESERERRAGAWRREKMGKRRKDEGRVKGGRRREELGEGQQENGVDMWGEEGAGGTCMNDCQREEPQNSWNQEGWSFKKGV